VGSTGWCLALADRFRKTLKIKGRHNRRPQYSFF
jgi:hypothetical protein